MTTERDDLAALVALDALDADEWADAEQRLASDVELRRAVTGHHETLSRLVADAPAPDGLLDAVRAEVAPGAGRVVRLERRRGRGARLVLLAAAAVAGLLLGAGAVALFSSSTSPDADYAAAVDAAFDDPAATVVELESAEGAVVGRVAVLPERQAFVEASELPSPPTGRTYQLWQLEGGEPISVGFLDDDSLADFALSGAADTVAISDEPEGGSPSPTGAVVASAGIAA